MKIVTISDVHNHQDGLKIPEEGDIIICSGDISFSRKDDVEACKYDVEEFLEWFGNLDYSMRILIAGNHDCGFEEDPKAFEKMCKNYGVTYLNDSGCSYQGVKIWGSPYTPAFCDWSFNRQISESKGMHRKTYPLIKPHWDKIPDNIDILITHGPPHMILDKCRDGYRAGCPWLLKRVEEIRPSMHIFGHIHEARGVEIDRKGSPITFVNSASVDLNYRLRGNEEFVFDYDKVVEGKSTGND